MSEIRDSAERQIAEVLVRVIKADRAGRQTEIDAVSQILSISEIAVVNREAKLPPLEIHALDKDTQKLLRAHKEIIGAIASMMGTTMISTGWVSEVRREVKDEQAIE